MESDIQRAEQGVRDLVADYRRVAKERDKHPEIPKILGEGQKLKYRLVDVFRIVITVGVAVGTIYVVLWILTHIIPW